MDTVAKKTSSACKCYNFRVSFTMQW